VGASRLAYAGGGWSGASYAGVFAVYVNYSASDADASIGARLMFL